MPSKRQLKEYSEGRSSAKWRLLTERPTVDRVKDFVHMLENQFWYAEDISHLTGFRDELLDWVSARERAA